MCIYAYNNSCMRNLLLAFFYAWSITRQSLLTTFISWGDVISRVVDVTIDFDNWTTQVFLHSSGDVTLHMSGQQVWE